jgi:hypothetical protein
MIHPVASGHRFGQGNADLGFTRGDDGGARAA